MLGPQAERPPCGVGGPGRPDRLYPEEAGLPGEREEAAPRMMETRQENTQPSLTQPSRGQRSIRLSNVSSSLGATEEGRSWESTEV